MEIPLHGRPAHPTEQFQQPPQQNVNTRIIKAAAAALPTTLSKSSSTAQSSKTAHKTESSTKNGQLALSHRTRSLSIKAAAITKTTPPAAHVKIYTHRRSCFENHAASATEWTVSWCCMGVLRNQQNSFKSTTAERQHTLTNTIAHTTAGSTREKRQCMLHRSTLTAAPPLSISALPPTLPLLPLLFLYRFGWVYTTVGKATA
jgi:hypothetical protein